MKYNYKAPFNTILLRYSEIGIKGNNRRLFEAQLLNNIKNALRDVPNLDFVYDFGRYALIHQDDSPFSDEEIEIIRENLSKVFGLETFSPGFLVDSDWESIRDTIMENIPAVHGVHAKDLAPGEMIQYRARVRRSFKKFPYRSNEIEIKLAGEILEKYPNVKVNLENPDMYVGVEVREDCTYIFFEFIQGPGGLPVGSSDKVLSLMSGGIDSPVACYQAMKRGSHVDYLTFHSHPYTSENVLEKIAQLINSLDVRQDKPGRYFACNMVEAQKMIRDRCMPRLRTVLYRRMMMRIATVLSRCLKSKALLTGESVGQVASQTLRNMDCINRSTDMLILRPLLSYDKNETIAIADKIGTFEISNIPAADSCTTFAPKKPATNANMFLVTQTEKNLDMDEAIRACLKDLVIINQQTMESEPYDKALRIFDKYYAGRWQVNEDTYESPR